MVLNSPGVEVTTIDESFYTPAPLGTVPLVICATAQDKTSGTGSGIAPGTTKATANTITLIGSQRELSATFGTPTFFKSASDSPLNGNEINEYGLMAAYSFLGISNRAFIVRADVNIAELTGSAGAPVGDPVDQSYWFDTSASKYGIQEWSASDQAFTNQVPIVITDSSNIIGGAPTDSVGGIDTYAIDATTTENNIWYKNTSNTWVQLGSSAWKISIPTIQGTSANPLLIASNQITINGVPVTLSGTTVTSLVSDITTAAIIGVTAAVVNSRLELYASDAAEGLGDSTTGAEIVIANGTGTPLATLGITAGTYYNPRLEWSAHFNIPEYRTTDARPRPTGSIWMKTTTANNGANLVAKLYSSTTDTFSTIAVPLYTDRASALFNLDLSGGGANIATGALFADYDITDAVTVLGSSPLGDFRLFRWAGNATTVVTGSDTTPVFGGSEIWTIQTSSAGQEALNAAVTISSGGATTAAQMVTLISAANPTNVTASVLTSGAIQFVHSEGGEIIFRNVSEDALTVMGITATLANVVSEIHAGVTALTASNWLVLTYEAKASQPSTDPATGTLWYNTTVDEVDIMVHNGTIWQAYQLATVDARGYDLSATSPNGPIVAAAAPTVQSDGTALVSGDLWIDTSNLELYMVIKRYNATTAAWVTLDTSDQTTQEGVLFADARYNTDQADNVEETIVNLLTNSFVDIDAPDPAIYPKGMLLVNTRRSGYNVKKFVVNYYNATDFPSQALPTDVDQWVTENENNANGSGSWGRKAQRKVITAALKATTDATTQLREEQREFNLIAAPGYPELIANMVALNNDRKQTAFIIADSPMRLAANSNDILNWSSNAGLAQDNGEDGLITSDEYLGVFWPQGSTTDLEGATITVPPSHMMLRTFANNDQIGYQWFAPAGIRRGTIDNVSSIGYIDAEGEFVTTAVQESLRDTLHANKVNALTFIPGQGLMNFGNLTRSATVSALDRINVARLLNYMRRQIDIIARQFLFEPNDKLTRDEIKAQMENLCNELITQRGLLDYLVVCDTSNNTPARIDRSELYVDIAIEPVKAVEFIFVPIRIKNTGEIGNLATA